MDTKPNLHNDRTKEQELYAPEGYIRPGVQTRQGMQASRASQTRQAAQVSQEVQISQVVQPNPDVLPAPAAQTSATAATVVKSEQGGSTIIAFDYDKYADVERKATHTNAIAGLTLGILSLVTIWFSKILAIILSIAGIVLSLKGRSEPGGKSMATAGLICSIIGLALSLLSILWTMIFVIGFIDGVNSLWRW